MSDMTVETRIANSPEIAVLLPPDVPADKFRSVALAAIRNNPNLLRCDQRSLFNACLAAAQDGLLPDGREGAIVPRKGRAVWQPMIQGIYKRVKTSGSVASLSANVVYEGEPFDVLLGDDDRIVHRRDMTKVGGQPVAVYAIATLKDGTKEREVMTWEQIMTVRQASASPNDGPWVQWPDEMARKTVVRRLAKRLPVLDPADERLHDAINRVDTLYDFGAQQQGNVVPVKAAAASMPAAPRKSDPTVYDTPKPEPLPRNPAEWNAWMDAFAVECTSFDPATDTRADLEALTKTERFKAAYAAAPPQVRRDIDRQLAATHAELPEKLEPADETGADVDSEAEPAHA